MEITTSIKNVDSLQQRSANFNPSVWGNFFITCVCDHKIIDVWREEARVLKEKVRRMLIHDLITANNLGDKLSIIDTIQRLGIAHHFQEDIQEMSQQIFELFDNKEIRELITSTLFFRLLRQHGYNVPCDIFDKLEDNKGEFKEAIAEDIQGLLSLYEATHLRLHGENILEKAFHFTKTTLESKALYLKPSLAAHVSHTLQWPVHKALPRLGARDYISFYHENELHNEDILKFAKLDFNILQLQHIEELKIISKWWKDLNVEKKLPYARDRIVECYFWILGVYHEPQYALARKFAVKVIALTSVLDDTYDVYGTYAELELLTEAFQRWEISVMDDLPEYMKVIYQAVLGAYTEMEEEMDDVLTRYAKNAMKRQVKAYLEESKWLHEKRVPSMEEYMKVATASTGYPLMAVVSSVGMGQVTTIEDFNWLISEPEILKSVYRHCRLMDDIASHQFERKREHIPSAVECYMKQHNVSASEACVELKDQIKNTWKDINQAFLEKNSPSMSVLTIILNLTRVMELLYKDDDIYTHSEKMKPYITSLLVNPLEI